METIVCATKRKKRKTRKCLDEIRKRSRSHTCETISVINSPTTTNSDRKISNFKKPMSNCMTSNRLTLAMFPKAIRSETITRPAVSVIERESVLEVCKVLGKEGTFNSLYKKPYNTNNDFVRNSVVGVNSALERYNERLQEGSASENLSSVDNSPASLILFSPVQQSTDTDVLEESANGETMSTPSQSSREDYGYNLYEEFMNEIPTYLKENAPALVQDDVIKKAKIYLHDIYIEGCQRECEDNVLQCIKRNAPTHRPFTPQEAVIQNPMDYIRLGYTWQQSVSQKFTETAVMFAGTSPLPSSLHSSATVHSFIQDTPEYTYYAHKLN